MRLIMLCDADWEAKLVKTLKEISAKNHRGFFEERCYGKGLEEITVVFMCQDPSLNLKQRIKYSNKSKVLYVDIMLDLQEMKLAAPDDRIKIVLDRLAKDLPTALQKYPIPNFDERRFVEDLYKWLIN